MSTTTFKIGDRVKVSDNPTTEEGGWVDPDAAGKVGVVTSVGKNHEVDFNDDFFQYIAPRHLTLVEFQIGDRVRLSDNPKASFPAGRVERLPGKEAVVIEPVDLDGDVRVRVGRGEAPYVLAEHLTLVEDAPAVEPEPEPEPMAEWERELLTLESGTQVRISDKPSASYGSQNIWPYAGASATVVRGTPDREGDITVRIGPAGPTLYVQRDHVTPIESETDFPCCDEPVEATLEPTPTVEDYVAAVAMAEAINPGSTKPFQTIVDAFAAHRTATR